MKDSFDNCLPGGTVLRGKAHEYQIDRVLGQGSFGITYLATVKIEGALGAIDASVAVKEFFMKEINGRNGTSVTSGSQHGLCEDYKRKFIREARNLSRLKHPNIVRVVEAFEANGTVYYAMEYINGGSLDDYILSHGRLSEQETVQFAREICSALQFMHKNGMLHLDLKPLNIMLRKGHAVLIDFGLSKQYDENGEPESSTKVGGGTLGYAPIEQSSYREGKGFPVTMDIYALGATMFKMLTGQRPPEAADILNEGLPTDELRKAGVSPWLVSLIEKCMNPMRKGRYQTVAEVLSVLQGNSPQGGVKVEVVYSPLSEETEIIETEPYVPEPASPKPTSGFINGHEYVDLGLSVKWATCNVGANSPEGYGSYFAWGETKPKPLYTDGNYAPSKKFMEEIAGNTVYDAARANWGGSWQLPTWKEIDELTRKCKGERATLNGQEGYKVTGSNGNSIFLPMGEYWSSSPIECDWPCAFYLIVKQNDFSWDEFGRRTDGRSVRPVSD